MFGKIIASALAILALLSLACLTAMVVGVGRGILRSEGRIVGTVVSCANEGLIWKTRECQICLGVVAEDLRGRIYTPCLYYSVLDPHIITKMDRALTEGGEVFVDYKKYIFASPWYGRASNEVVGVKPLAGIEVQK